MTSLPFSFTTTALYDTDQYRERANQQGWDLDTRQLSRGPNQINFDHVAFPEFSVANHRVKQAMYDVFDIPSRHIVFVICRAKLPAVWCGKELPPSVLALHRPGRTYRARLPAGWDTYEFTVSEEMIERTELLPPEVFEETIRLEEALLPLVEPQTGYFLKTVDSCFQMLRVANGAMAGTVSGTEIYNLVFDGLQQVIDTGLAAGDTRPLRPTRRADLVEQARDLMIANVKLDLTADELAQSLGVSYRVLNYAFQDTLGLSCYQYFLTEKLHAVRRMLKTSDASISEACKSHGFSTPSRFTQQYKRLFGELPSETCKRKTVQIAVK